MGLFGFHDDFSREVFIAGLPDHDLVLSRKKHDLLISLELLQETDVLPVNPHPRIFIDSGCSGEPKLSHDLLLRSQAHGSEQAADGNSSKGPARGQFMCRHFLTPKLKNGWVKRDFSPLFRVRRADAFLELP